MTKLIINADDYGLTTATSKAIVDCHAGGVVTSTSLLTLASGYESTVGWLRDLPDIGVGVHLALVGEDPPLLSAAEIPSLVDGSGRLHGSWREFMRAAVLGRIDSADVERELGTQIDRALASGVRLTHLDSHQHLHEWPSLFAVIRRLADRAGVRAVRTTRSGGLGAMHWLGRLTAVRAGRVGLATTDRFAGFSHSGRLTESALLEALDAVPDGTDSVEIGCHPGAVDDADRARYDWGFRWADEAAGLRSQRVRDRIEERGFELSTFADLVGAQ